MPFNTFLCCLCLLFLFACNEPEEYQFSQGEVFSTSYHIKYEYRKNLDEEIIEQLKRFDLSLNPFNTESIIYKVNNNLEVEPDDYFITVFNKSQEVSEKSEGAFDITCAPLVNLWGFGFSRIDSVTPEKVEELKQFVGYEKIRLIDGKVVKDDPRVLLNMSAIAKGYACDVVALLFEKYKIRNYMIEIGGEIVAKGKNPSDQCWRIEITKPVDDSTGVISDRQEVVQLCNRALATSGNYRNFYMKNGKKYAHTIDPHTGYPAEQNMLSATVVASDCMTADAYATAFMTMGLEKACRLADTMPELAYYFVYEDETGNRKVAFSDNMDIIRSQQQFK